MSRRLKAEEQALWALVAATVRPIHPSKLEQTPPPTTQPAPPAIAPRKSAGPQRLPPIPPATPGAPPRAHPETLDGSWDKRLAGGRLEPDMTVDLHGLTRDSARHLLYRRVQDADARGLRVILVITGKGHMPGPAPADMVPGLNQGRSPRGSIKADLPRWLGEEGLTQRIAAVRRAHPRHGGAGAAYLILKRKRA